MARNGLIPMIPVKFAHDCKPCDCCGEPWCSKCEAHYADCECVGPGQTDEYDYETDDDGEMWATLKPENERKTDV